MNDKKSIEMKLIDNPKYSSNWVDVASKLISEYDLTEEELSKYNAQQLNIIMSAFDQAKNNIGIYKEGFLNPKLNDTQMQIILTGYSHNLTTEQLKPYFNPEIPYIKSNWAVTALTEGFNIDEYVKNGFNKEQLYELYAGLKDGVDITTYDNINISAEKMAIAHHSLVLGLNVTIKNNDIIIN